MTIPSSPPPADPSQGKLSAEERLLEVIQNGGASPVPEKSRPFKKISSKIRSALKRKPHPGRKPTRGSPLASANQVLVVLMILGLVLSAVSAFAFKPDIGKIYSRVAGAPKPQGHPNLKPLAVDELMTSIAGRNLFQPKMEESTPPADAARPPPGGKEGILENLELVGIAFGAHSEVMIREKKEGRTFFLKEGETFKGVLVKQILKDRVIVEFGQETKELM